MLSNLSNLFVSEPTKKVQEGSKSAPPAQCPFSARRGYTTSSGREDWLKAHQIPAKDWDKISTQLEADLDPEVTQ